jgi:hypothetical protein
MIGVEHKQDPVGMFTDQPPWLLACSRHNCCKKRPTMLGIIELW